MRSPLLSTYNINMHMNLPFKVKFNQEGLGYYLPGLLSLFLSLRYGCLGLVIVTSHQICLVCLAFDFMCGTGVQCFQRILAFLSS